MSIAVIFGSQWVGEVPNDWKTVPARKVFTERKERSNPADIHLTPSQKYAVLPQSEYMKTTGGRVVLNLTGADNMKHVEKGDFVVHLRSFQGGIEYSKYAGKVSNAYTVLTPVRGIIDDFYRYVLKSHGFISELAKTTDQLRDGQSIKYSQLALLKYPLPKEDIQQKIADFLDTETAKIDDLIAKQERLLELLEEKRRATITHAVTRGLDPNVEVKETTIPWLGQIPALWRISRVKDVADVVLGKMVQNEQKKPDEQLKPYLKSRNIQWDGVNLANVDNMWFKPAELLSYQLKDHDIIVSEGGEVGKCVMWQKVYGEMYFQNSVNRVRVKENIDPKYIYYVFQHLALNKVFMNTVNKVSIAHLTKDKIVTYHIPTPSKAEQKEISDFLDAENTAFRKLKQKIQTQISLLRERRTSLISHAVTGKVKV
jgi:type I restriction enzyme S subunit